jgi:putative DNA primase/helicase
MTDSLANIRVVVQPKTDKGNDAADWQDDPEAVATFKADIDAAAVEIKAVPATEMSEDWLALRFVDRYNDLFRWTSGMDWMFHDGSRWVHDKQLLKRFAMCRQMCRELGANKQGREAERLSSAKTVASILTLAKCDQRIVTASDSWDAEIDTLNTPLGLVCLRTGKVLPCSHRHLMTKLAIVTPSRGDCPRWLQFLSEVFPADQFSDSGAVIEFIQTLLGYVITGSVSEQKVFFFFGKGSNGKSVLMDLMRWIMGGYAMKLSSETLMQSSHSRHPTELAQLQGKRLAASSELEDGQYWAEARLKELTGDETLSARFMKQDFFDFKQTQKHLIAGNYRPRLKGGDEAMQRRIVLIPFKAKFEGHQRDDNLLEKLKSEGPQIMHWMIQGAVRWFDSGLVIPDCIKQESSEYMAEMDDLAQWIEDCCELSPGAEQFVQTLYDSHLRWKQARNENAQGMTQWRGRLLQQMPEIQPGQRKKNGRPLVGICLTATELHKVQGHG